MWIVCKIVAASAVLAGLVLAAASAEEINPLAGTWKIRAFYTEDVRSKGRHDVYGPHPTGIMQVRPDGHFTARVRSYKPMPVLSFWDDVANVLASESGHAITYTGAYRADGESLFIQVNSVRHEGPVGPDTFDMSWDEGRTIGEDERSFQIITGSDQKTQLVIETKPMPNPNGAGNTIVGRTIWQRVPD